MMFEQYVKLFHLGWIETWMVEALIIMSGALLLGVVLCKVAGFLNGDQQ
jgi:hypothetical protein